MDVRKVGQVLTEGEKTMRLPDKDINLVLIANDPGRASILQRTMETVGIRGVIRRIDPGSSAIDCARQSGTYCNKALPDLIFFDITDPTEKNTEVLNEVAFGEARSRVPVVLLTNSDSPELLEDGRIDDTKAVMFSPTSLPSFVGKMKNGKRGAFFRALKTLYQYGPILVRLPVTAQRRDFGVTALSA